MKNIQRYIVFAIAMCWETGIMAITSTTYTKNECIGNTITLKSDSFNVDFFQWYKDGVKIPGATNATLDVTIENYTSHHYSVISKAIDPEVGDDNLFDNGSFETEFTTPALSHFGSEYNYCNNSAWGRDPEMIYNKPGASGASNLFVITSNAHRAWPLYDDISADDGRYYALFDAGKAGKAWYANTSDNPRLVITSGTDYVFSYSAVNVNVHDCNTKRNAAYKNIDNWSNVYCYIYDAFGTEKLGAWPGKKATYSSVDGLYHVALTEDAFDDWKIVWNNGLSGDDECKTPDMNYHELDKHPSKLQFIVRDLNTNKDYPLDMIDLDCSQSASTHQWIRRQAVMKATFSSNNIEISVRDLNSAVVGNDFGLDRIIFQYKNLENSRPVDSTVYIVNAVTPEFTVTNPAAECSDGTARTLTLNYNITNGAPYYYTIDYANASIADVTTQKTLTKKTGKGTITLSIPANIYGTQTGTLKMWDQGKNCTAERDFSFTLNKIPELAIGKIANIKTDATELKIAYTVPAGSSAATWSVLVNDSHFGTPSDIAVVSSGTTVSIPVSVGVTPGTYTATITVKSSAGCMKVYTMQFQVLGSVGIEFAHSPYQVCEGVDSIEIDYSVTVGTPATYTLSFSGGNFTAVTSRTDIPASPWKIALNGTPAGTYTMTATVYNPAGDVHTQSSAQIIVNPIPTMTLTIPNVCLGMDYVTVMYTSVDADSYVYTFEGVTSSAQPAATEGSFDLDISSLTPGEYIVHVMPDNAAGCTGKDTQASFTILAPRTAEETVSSCGSYVWNGTTYTESGDYEYATTTSLGCDSVVMLHLTIRTDDLMYTKWGNLVLCADRNRDIASYQWYINGAEVPSATGQYFTGDDRILTEKLSVRAITQTGDTLYSCEKTFAEITKSSDQSKEEYTLSQNGPVRVYSISGRLLHTAEGNINDVIGHLPAGIYILRYDDKSFRYVVY